MTLPANFLKPDASGVALPGIDDQAAGNPKEPQKYTDEELQAICDAHMQRSPGHAWRFLRYSNGAIGFEVSKAENAAATVVSPRP